MTTSHTYHYSPSQGLWLRRGRPAVIPPYFNDGFQLGVTRPDDASICGPLPSSARPLYAGPTTIDGSSDPQNPLLIEHVTFTRPITIRSGYVTIRDFEATNMDGLTPGFETALVNTSSAGVLGVRLERGLFDPGEEGAHHYLNAVTGHHTTLHRCRARRVVDFFGSFNVHGPVTDNRIEGCWLEWLCYFHADQPGVVHPSDVRTHNDGVQHQGGSGLTVIGNVLYGYVFFPDGWTVPTDQGEPAWEHLAHQGILTQQNVQFGAAINPVVHNNWVYGFQHPFVFKTRASDGTGYDTSFQNNTLMNDDQRRYGVTADIYGNAQRPYTVRLDNTTTVNGVEYPTTANEFQIDGNNRYDDSWEVTRPSLRGQPITVRRDPFGGG